MRSTLLLFTLSLALASPSFVSGQTPAAAAPAAAAEAPFPVEYYYKAKWGAFNEFRELFKKNHYPVLLEEQALGRILRIDVAYPTYHGTEDGRWDMRVTLVWKNVVVANDDFDTAPILKKLYPEQARFTKEEQRRFELLEAHWDLPLTVENLSTWK